MEAKVVKVGDRVRVSGRRDWTDGLIGVIVGGTEFADYLVQFSPEDAKRRGHDGSFGDDELTRSFVNEYEVERVPDRVPATPPTFTADLRLTPQAKTILSHLKAKGRISPAKANVVYGISRLASCIHEIRKVGYKVKTRLTQDEQGHKYAEYKYEQPATVH